MGQQRLKELVGAAALVVVVIGVVWWGLRKLDPTSSAIFLLDSPDGQYRCAVFCSDGFLGGNPEYEAGLFAGDWPHRELPGGRAKWNYDSVSSSDFHPAWHSDGVDINFSTGYGDDRATVYGRNVGGKQEWR